MATALRHRQSPAAEAQQDEQLPTLLQSKPVVLKEDKVMMPVKEKRVTGSTDEDQPSEFIVGEGFILPAVLTINAVLQLPLAFFMPESPIRFIPLVVQLYFMSLIVYRSSETARDHRYQTPVQNVLRVTFGSVLMGLCEIATVHRIWDRVGAMEDDYATMWVLVRVCGFAAVTCIQAMFTYGMCSISEYMLHRFLWHAHWAKDPLSPLMSAVRRQWVQHYIGHHRHSNDPETKEGWAQLKPGFPTEEKKQKLEQSSVLTPDDAIPMLCSNHGTTVGVENDSRVPFWMKWMCRMHTSLMYLLLPSGTGALMQALNCSPFGWLRHIASSALVIYVNFHHDKYHCPAEMREHWAKARFGSPRSGADRLVCAIGRAFWLCNGMKQVTDDHRKHHYCPEHREEYYGLLPYGHYFVYSMFQSW